MIKTDMDMIVMRAKLRYLLDNYQLYYSRNVGDYTLIHNDDWTEQHEEWKQAKLATDKLNERWKRNQFQREEYKKKQRTKKATVSNRDKKLKVPLVCEHCGYTYTSVYTGAFQQHHGDKCRFKKTKHEG